MASGRMDPAPEGEGPPCAGGDAVSRLLADAIRTAQAHVDDGGICGGCLLLWARLTFWPCTQALWARAVLTDHGVPLPPPNGPQERL